jgi:hypothetical protein
LIYIWISKICNIKFKKKIDGIFNLKSLNFVIA